MQLIDGCKPRWHFKYVQKIPEGDAGPGATRGTEGHGRIEDYLTTGINNLDPLEFEGVRAGFIPEPGEGLYIEQPIGLTYDVLTAFQLHGYEPITAGEFGMAGFIDLVNTRFLAVDGTLELTDWKFKKTRYEKLPVLDEHGDPVINSLTGLPEVESTPIHCCSDAELLDPESEAGIQMIPYAMWAVVNAHLFPGMKRIRVRHITFQTKGAKNVRESKAVADLTRIGALWDIVTRRIVPKVQESQAATDVQSLEKNTSLCWKYPPNGCPYKSKCLTRDSLFASFGAPMGLLSSVVASSNGVIPPPAASAPPRVIIQDESTPTIAAKDATPGTRYRVGSVLATFLCIAEGKAMFMVNGAPPFSVELDTQVLAPTESAAGGTPAQAPAQAANVQPATTPAAPPAPAPEPSAALVPEPAAVEAPKKTKAKKADPIHTESAPPTNTALAFAPQATAAHPYAGVYLYVGCAPIGVTTSTLIPLALEAEAKTVQAGIAGKVDGVLAGMDLRVVGGNTFGFGKWVAYFEAAAKTIPIAPGHYIATTGDARVEAVTRVLMGILPPGNVILAGGR